MEHTEILADITNSCRLCLKSNTNIRNIFDNNHQKWAEIDISEQILQATTIKVTINDGAIGICRSCLQNIVAVNNFQRKCLKIDKYLKTKYHGIYFNNSCSDNERTTISSNLGQFVDIGNEIEHTKTFLLDDIDGLSNSMPSPIFDDFIPTDNDEEKSDDITDLARKMSEEIQASEKIEKQPLMKCKYTLKNTRKMKPFEEPWPKLKKRDLNQSKAYVGLCHLCGKHFNHLWVHLQSHSDIPTDTCDICGKGFRSKTSLSLHILMHKDADMPCEICGKRYRTKMRLKRHMRVHTNNRPFSCNICQKKFYTKYNVDVHMRIHTGEKPFNCDYCAERFTHSYALKHHVKKFHVIPES